MDTGSDGGDTALQTGAGALTLKEAEQRRAFWNEANALIIDSLYSARGNQVAANRWSTWATALVLPASLLSAVLATGAAVSTLGTPRWVTATVALAVAPAPNASALRPTDEIIRAR